MANQVDPRGTRYRSNGTRHATLTGNQRVASPIAHLSCDMDPAWRMDRKYRRLFFLDEATALAYGHRPCNRCRRARLREFQAAWTGAGLGPSTVASIDRLLHAQRGTTHPAVASELPEGTMIEFEDDPHLVFRGSLRRWTPQGYDGPRPLPRGEVAVLTPPAVVSAIAAGYRPVLHPSVSV